MVAELRLVALTIRQMIDHLLGNIGLEFGVLDPARIACDMKDQLSRLRHSSRDVRETIGNVVVIRRQPQRSRQWLEARVAVTDRI
jgi:hypothetical protein